MLIQQANIYVLSRNLAALKTKNTIIQQFMGQPAQSLLQIPTPQRPLNLELKPYSLL